MTWRYEGQYAVYDLHVTDTEAEIANLIDPAQHFFAIYVEDTFIGHAVFHAEARVAGGDYTANALDVGAGMRPDWTGQGKGASIIGAILDFAQVHYRTCKFRATIAAWNQRAQKATIANGFVPVSRFKATQSGKEFIILCCDRCADTTFVEGTA